MNFKEVYKNANNSIQANKALIDTIYEKAEKSKKPKVINYSVFGSLAGAVAVFLLIFNTVNFNTGKIKSNDTQIAKNNVVKTQNSDILNTEKTEPKTEEPYTYSEKQLSADTQKQVAKTNEERTSTTYEKALPNTDLNTSADTAQAESVEDMAFNPNARMASGGGGGSSATNNDVMTAHIDSTTADEGLIYEFYMPDKYYDYIGINPTKVAVIPSDMAFNEFYGTDITTDANGIIVNDTAIFTAFNSTMEKSIAIEVTKLEATAQTPFADDAVGLKATAFTSGGCLFSVTTFNIAPEEFDTLITSLKQN